MHALCTGPGGGKVARRTAGVELISEARAHTSMCFFLLSSSVVILR